MLYVCLPNRNILRREVCGPTEPQRPIRARHCHGSLGIGIKCLSQGHNDASPSLKTEGRIDHLAVVTVASWGF